MDKKKIMLACDAFAAVCTVLILVLYQTGGGLDPGACHGRQPKHHHAQFYWEREKAPAWR
ncbi:MAG: hypothetical protein K5746_11095 [Clostridiales bacterium]|nr:hypothetical protein [Clostridiales bacterium]